MRILFRPAKLFLEKIYPRKDFLFILSLWVIATAINLFKPFHIDDAFHLEVAKWIMENPLNPMGAQVNWQDFSRAAAYENNPPLYFYFIALVGKTVGINEVNCHLMQSVFSFICIYLFHKLAKIVATDVSKQITGLLILGPVFLVNQNLMLDVPLLAFELIIIYLLVVNRDRLTIANAIIISFSFSIAVLIKYSALALILPIGIVFLMKNNRKKILILIIPAATIISWIIFTKYQYGFAHISGRNVHQTNIIEILKKCSAFIICLGALVPLWLLHLKPLFSVVSNRLFSILAHTLSGVSVALILATMLDLLPGQTNTIILTVVFFGSGLITVSYFFKSIVLLLKSLSLSNYKQYLTVVIGTWIIGNTLLILAVAPFIATRHLLLVIPGIILIISHAYPLGINRNLFVGLVITIFLGLFLSISDWTYAAFYKTSASEIANRLPPNSQKWVYGHWGWQWYAQNENMDLYEYKKTDVKPGDYVIIPSGVYKQKQEKTTSLLLKETIIHQPDWRTFFSTANGASFYASSNRRPPWFLTKQPLDTIKIYQVTP